jgi:hypothetical protein
MFAKLEFLEDTTMNDCLSDLVAVMCGETDPNNLLAVVVGGSYINTDLTTSPWELHDDVAGNHKVIRTLQADSQEYKYVGFHHDNGPITSGYYSMSVMYDWDNSLHTGTDVYGPDFNYLNVGQRQQVDNFWWYIYADEFMIYVMPHSDFDMVGSSAGPNIDRQSFFHGEVTRDHPSMKIGDMPNWFVASTIIFGGEASSNLRPCIFPRGRNYLGNDVAPLRVQAGWSGRGQYLFTTQPWTPDTVGSIKSPEVLSGPTAFPVERFITGSSSFHSGSDIYDYAGDISERCDIWSLPEGSVNIFDQLIFKGKAYICLKSGHDSSVTGLATGSKVMVPYG